MARFEVRSDIAGTVWKIVARPGDEVGEGAPIVILESMKMEIEIATLDAGTVLEIRVTEGEAVSDNQVIAVLEAR